MGFWNDVVNKLRETFPTQMREVERRLPHPYTSPSETRFEEEAARLEQVLGDPNASPEVIARALRELERLNAYAPMERLQEQQRRLAQGEGPISGDKIDPGAAGRKERLEALRKKAEENLGSVEDSPRRREFEKKYSGQLAGVALPAAPELQGEVTARARERIPG